MSHAGAWHRMVKEMSPESPQVLCRSGVGRRLFRSRHNRAMPFSRDLRLRVPAARQSGRRRFAKASAGKGMAASGNIAPQTNAAAASGAGKNAR
ncbi:hypothetical protein J2W30_001780 [Variovorax boronicumulans]|uniref:hypothetical protein n=1 Tax=Variovorax boronicumulans TaxID=436515 RepID=UPI0027816391|nr:hypothetical protein [Variovorax boronicumulans]MDQ0034025.1 hypothetical protein [Variovorax boronicumulans]